MKTITGQWKFPDGSAAANAILYLQLSQDAVVVGQNQVAPRVLAIALDGTGSIPANTQIFANDELNPEGTVYIVSVIAPGGGKIYGPDLYNIAGASPINLNNSIPATVGGTGVFLGNPVLQNPSSAQSITGQPLTLTSTAALTVNSNALFTGLLTFATLVSNTGNAGSTGNIRLASSDSIVWRNNANTGDNTLNKDSSDFLRLDHFPTAVSNSLTSANSSPSGTGVLRLASSDVIGWRNNANTGDVQLSKDSSDNLNWPNAIKINIPTGTAPLTIASTTLVPNLNIQIINGVTVTGTPSTGQTLVATGAAAASWSSAITAIQAVTTNSISTTSITNSNTTVSSIAVTFPSAGGPFRVFISYSLYLDFTSATNQANIDFWVSDGTNAMAGTQTGQSNASSGAKTLASYGGFSTVSYANGASKTFTLLGFWPGTGTSPTVQGAPTSGSGPNSSFQITVLPSVS